MVFGLEGEGGFWRGGLVYGVAEGVVGAGVYYLLLVVGEDSGDGADLVFDVGVPAVGVGKEVGGGFGKFDVALDAVFAHAVHVAAYGGVVTVQLHGQVVLFPVEMDYCAVNCLLQSFSVDVIGVGGHDVGGLDIAGIVLVFYQAIPGIVIVSFGLCSGPVPLLDEVTVGIVLIGVGISLMIHFYSIYIDLRIIFSCFLKSSAITPFSFTTKFLPSLEI